MRSSHLALVAVALVGLGVLAACGGSSETARPAETTAPAAGEATELPAETTEPVAAEPDVENETAGALPADRLRGLADWPPEPSCGSYVNLNQPPEETSDQVEANECIVSAFEAGDPAEVVATYSTVEGDPIVNYIRVLGPNTVEVFVDTTADVYGPRGWLHQLCERLTEQSGFLQPDGCTDVAVDELLGAAELADVEGAWLFTGGTLAGREIPLSEGYRITLVVENDLLSGQAPCNRYGTRGAEIGRGVIEMTEPVGQTALGCPSELLTETERMYLAAFASSTQITLVDGRLRLAGPNESVLRYERLPDVPIEEIAERDWQLESIARDGRTISPTDGAPTFTLGEEGSFRATTGCRTLTAEYVVQGDEILATRSGAEGECPDDLTEQDSVIVEALGDGFTAQVEAVTLTVESRGNLTLTYRALRDQDKEGGESIALPPTDTAPANPGRGGGGRPAARLDPD